MVLLPRPLKLTPHLFHFPILGLGLQLKSPHICSGVLEPLLKSADPRGSLRGVLCLLLRLVADDPARLLREC